MKLLSISKFLMILILPFLLLLFFSIHYGFDNSFYQEKFSQYNVQKKVPNAYSLHEKVMNFIDGRSNALPNDFNEREKQHLQDVRAAARMSMIVFYVLIILFVVLMSASLIILKVNTHVLIFAGKIFVFGGILTLLLSAILFLFLRSDFSGTFEAFHNIFFKRGTYLFNPEKEIIVNLYPEKLFMDIGIQITKGVILSAVSITIIGIIFILISKPKRINKEKIQFR